MEILIIVLCVLFVWAVLGVLFAWLYSKFNWDFIDRYSSFIIICGPLLWFTVAVAWVKINVFDKEEEEEWPL